MRYLGVILKEQGKLSEAVSMTREALEAHQRILGFRHPYTLNCRHDYGVVLMKLGRFGEAEQVLREGLETVEKFLPSRHDLRGYYPWAYGDCFLGLKRYAEAEEYLLKAHGFSSAVFGDRHALTLSCVDSLRRLYEAWNKPAKAEEWREKGREATVD
jgi:tetratricopeptide (TPR) repeat protein